MMHYSFETTQSPDVKSRIVCTHGHPLAALVLVINEAIKTKPN